MDERDLLRWVEVALAALVGAPIPLAGAEEHIPPCPGLYTISGAAGVWRELGLGEAPDARPLYVGKSESDLVSRDLEYHFGDEGRTGWASPRRSFAALLHDPLGLRGVPRTPDNPGYYSCFGLAGDGDTKLTEWMRDRLWLAIWPLADECPYDLETLEKHVIRALQPPLNLTHVSHEWKKQLKLKRKVMAHEARLWAATRA